MKSYTPFQLFFVILLLTTGCQFGRPDPEATVPAISIPTIVLNEVNPTISPPEATEPSPTAAVSGSDQADSNEPTVPAPPADPNPADSDIALDQPDSSAKPCIATPDYATETYLVQNGDTLFALAQLAELSLAELGALNCLPQASWASIEVGQPLKVPAGFSVSLVEPASGNTPTRLSMPAGSDTLELRREQLSQNQIDSYLFAATADQVLFLNVNTNSPNLEAILSGPNGEKLPISVQHNTVQQNRYLLPISGDYRLDIVANDALYYELRLFIPANYWAPLPPERIAFFSGEDSAEVVRAIDHALPVDMPQAIFTAQAGQTVHYKHFTGYGSTAIRSLAGHRIKEFASKPYISEGYVTFENIPFSGDYVITFLPYTGYAGVSENDKWAFELEIVNPTADTILDPDSGSTEPHDETLSFDPGSDYLNIKRTIPANAQHIYRFTALQGQEAILTLNAKNQVDLDLLTPTGDELPLVLGQENLYRLPTDGAYRIVVDSAEQEVDLELSLRIPGWISFLEPQPILFEAGTESARVTLPAPHSEKLLVPQFVVKARAGQDLTILSHSSIESIGLQAVSESRKEIFRSNGEAFPTYVIENLPADGDYIISLYPFLGIGGTVQIEQYDFTLQITD